MVIFLLFQLFGLAMIGVGVAVLLKWSMLTDLLRGHLTVAPWVFIVIGAIMFVIAFFGCCGAIRESHCMVVTVRVHYFLRSAYPTVTPWMLIALAMIMFAITAIMAVIVLQTNKREPQGGSNGKKSLLAALSVPNCDVMGVQCSSQSP